MEEPIDAEETKSLEGEGVTAVRAQAETTPSTRFVKVEKNLASLGFFTPSSKRLRNAQEKSFTITTVSDGQRLELKGTIIPSTKYGLPITADQDKWIALCKLLTDIIRKEGRVTNPVAFTSADILRLLHKHRHSGKNYHEIEEWLDVLFSTTIFSEGVVYLSREKRRVKDRFRVFDRAVSFGKELPDGKVADKNYVWFSDWQLQNINDNHLLPIDLEAYRELRNHIAKALVPLLQVWLYATRREGVYEKRYDELCQILNIRQYEYESLIKRTLGMSLDELKKFGYLSDWKINRTSDDENYKIVFYHGEKFYRDRRARLIRKSDPDSSSATALPVAATTAQRIVERPQIVPAGQLNFDPALVSEFTKRGITEKKTYELLANLKPAQNIVAQLEYYDHLIEHAGFHITNPPGFYIRLIERNLPIPDGFETAAQRNTREVREAEEKAERLRTEARQELEDEYERYQDNEIDRAITENPAAFEDLKNTKWAEDRARYSFTTESMARIAARQEIRKQLTLLTFQEFLARKRHDTDFFLKSVAPSLVAEPAADPAEPEDLLAADERREAAMRTEAMEKEGSDAPDATAVEEPPSEPAMAPGAPLVSNDEEATELAISDGDLNTSDATPPASAQQHEASPEIPNPMMIEFVSDPPKEELGDILPGEEAA